MHPYGVDEITLHAVHLNQVVNVFAEIHWQVFS